MRIVEHSVHATCAEPFVPPRCRKPRVKLKPCMLTARLRQYDASEAPVVFRVKDRTSTREYRLADGALYIKAPGVASGWAAWVETRIDKFFLLEEGEPWSDCTRRFTEFSLQKNLDKKLEDMVLIGDELWTASGMPCYRVLVFGDGSVSVGHEMRSEEGLRRESGRDWEYCRSFFAPSDKERAERRAIELADGRGDLFFLDEIEVIDSSGIIFDPQKLAAQIRNERAEAELEEAEARLALCRVEREDAREWLSTFSQASA